MQEIIFHPSTFDSLSHKLRQIVSMEFVVISSVVKLRKNRADDMVSVSFINYS